MGVGDGGYSSHNKDNNVVMERREEEGNGPQQHTFIFGYSSKRQTSCL